MRAVLVAGADVQLHAVLDIPEKLRRAILGRTNLRVERQCRMHRLLQGGSASLEGQVQAKHACYEQERQ